MSRPNLMIVRVYKSRHQWRWQIRDYNNRKIVGASTEGYTRQHHCRANFQRTTGFPAPVAKAGEKEARLSVWAGRRAWNVYPPSGSSTNYGGAHTNQMD